EGDIPSEIGTMKMLQKLTLHHNEFTGQVPNELCNLRDGSLHFLWVDCSPLPSTNVPKISCPIENCCSICFEGYDDDGGPSTGGSSPPPANADGSGGTKDTPHSVQNDNSSDLKTLLSSASHNGGASLLDIASPQFHAYAWLVEDIIGKDYSNERTFQRYALATLYFGTNGVHWTKSDNWLTNADECIWYGISGCMNAAKEKIISLELKDNRLEGEIPPELFGFLPNVVVLNLATNALTGEIPTEIGMLVDIDILELAENQLTGYIPTELGDLETVSHVFLQSNNFENGQTMPGEVCDLRSKEDGGGGSLTLLWADCRGDASDAYVLCDTMCCTTCFSGGANGDEENPFNGESDEAVTHADSEGNVLATLKKMAPDGGVTLDDSLSPQFKAYSWLVGSINSSYESLSDVLLLQRYAFATLYFGTAGHGWTEKTNWLASRDVCDWALVAECNGGKVVTSLDLHSNNLVGRIPLEITHLRLIEILDLTDNELYGSVPTEFGWFEDLEILRLGGNLLTGNIPSELGNLSTLHELYIHVNDFSGIEVPAEVCALRSEDGNGLSTVWADCEGDWALVYCDESCCDQCFSDDSDFEFYAGYTGDVITPYPTLFPTASAGTVVPGRNYPPTASPVAAAPSLENEELKTYLLGHMNGFEDRLSDTSSDAYQAYLWLANTRGFEELDDFRKLQRFGLVTFFKSTTPSLDWKVSNRWQTHEDECGWFGISCAIDNTVTEISLPSNRLSGTIPPEIALAGLGGEIGKLNLSGNNIGGQLVDEIGDLKHLEVLDLRANDFIGKIPTSLGKLNKLKSLLLQDNDFTGDMPLQICSLVMDGDLEALVADCDAEDAFSTVNCDMDTCCTECD
ncbi:hypothetical protein ACHAXR_004872, partial [Thalassiosira sp. AJA248-18]